VKTPHAYTGLKIIGNSAFATTYRADCPAHGGAVVVKVFRREALMRPEGVNGFVADYRRIRSVESTSLAMPVEAGTVESGEPYITRRRVPSPSLASQVATGTTLGLVRSLRLGSELAATAAALHRRRLLHLGITPTNVFVLEDGSIVLTDPLPRSVFLATPGGHSARPAH